MKFLIVIPTYNERDNIADIISAIRHEAAELEPDILVVDSASPDGTSGRVEEIRKNDSGVFLYPQKAKLGLGHAYLDGMRWALDRNYDCLVTMDADFSHHPRYLKGFVREIKRHDLVIGSRYVAGGELRNWPKDRQILSQFANWYAGTLMGMPFRDLTSGFHCFRIPLLKKVLRYRIHAEGYAFLMELKFLSILQKARFREIPIVFSDRTKGNSKISKRVAFESMLFVLIRFFHRGRIKNALAEMRQARLSLQSLTSS